MKTKLIRISGLVAIVVLALTVGLIQAQDPPPPDGVGTQAALGTAFTYQGQLKQGGNPVNGTCDLQFGLWDAASGGTQIGSPQTATNVSMSNGLFNVQLDLGTGAFNGEARWLAISVRCPAGSGSYTPLSPRQPLAPAPYALALPGLWTQQNATSPNIIGGYSGNQVTGGVIGATIGGGGAYGSTHRVTDDYGTVGGGLTNRAGNDAGSTTDARYATVGGGIANTAGGELSTVGGGWGNNASGQSSIVGGGQHNRASGARSTVGGGNNNDANGYHSTVGGGDSNDADGNNSTVGGGGHNTASGSSSTVGGGFSNDADGNNSTVGGGGDNTAGGTYSTVGGGSSNTASGSFATVPGGVGAAATHYGEMAYAAGYFNTSGDAQMSFYVLRNTSPSGFTTELFLDGNAARLTIAPGRTIVFDAMIVGRDANGNSAGYQITGVMENAGGTTAYVGSAVLVMQNEDVPAWSVSILANDVHDALEIFVINPGSNVRWVAVVRTVEVQGP